MAFTTLILFQLFNVFNARSDDDSAFRGLFENRWLWAAVVASAALQVVVVYTPFLQRAFSTESLTVSDWLRCRRSRAPCSWLREIDKFCAQATTCGLTCERAINRIEEFNVAGARANEAETAAGDAITRAARPHFFIPRLTQPDGLLYQR